MKFCAVCQRSFEDGVTFCPRDGEVLEESPEAIVGRVIDGKYEVESFLAQGGMGAVYLARHLLLGDRVVIKTLRSEMRTNTEWLKRFQREGKAARSFRHPNSVTVYDLSANPDGLIYMVMEYVEGHTLDRELKQRGRLTPREAVEVLEPVADALDAAHARGVVHRDLKPENIMLGRDAHGERLVKVLDLGIAKLVGDDAYAASATVLTKAGQILGTPYYMSPEQWGELPRDGRPEVDGRTDIYSLGVIVFELVAGRRPLTGRTLAELRQKHVAEPPPALEEAAPGVTREFGRAVARATAKDRADRPATAGAFLDELRAALGLPLRSRAGAATRPADPPPHVLGTRAAGEAATAQLSADALEPDRAATLLTSALEGRGTDGGRAAASAGTRSAGRGGATVASEAVEAAVAPHGARAEVPAHGAAPRGHAPDVKTVAPRARFRLAHIVLGGALVLTLCAAAVAGWLAWGRATRGAEGREAPAADAPTVAPAPPAAAPRDEVLSYWLEVFERPEDTAGRRLAETNAALATGQRFRFHFDPRRRGYLYIVGPGGDGNALMMFLTAQGAGPLKSNLVVGDADFAFPNWTRLRLEGGAGTEDYTVIFSPTPLVEPAFLTGRFQHRLTAAEVKEFEELRARYDASSSALEVREEGGAARVVVSAPARPPAENAPVIFDIRISHR